MKNQIVADGLPKRNRTEGIPAYLLGEDGKVLYTFLYNPESKEYSRSIEYGESEIALSSVAPLQYKRTSGRTLSLPDLLLESWSDSRSLRPQLEGLEALAVADPANGKFSPPIVYFAWGSEVFGAAVLTDISWKETLWVGGEPAEARLNITLKQVPNPTDPKFKPPTAPVQAAANDGVKRAIATATNNVPDVAAQSNSQSLTDRQRQDGVSKAAAYVAANLSTLPTPVRQAYRSRSYAIAVDASGAATFKANSGYTIKIGDYDGSKFTTASS